MVGSGILKNRPKLSYKLNSRILNKNPSVKIVLESLKIVVKRTKMVLEPKEGVEPSSRSKKNQGQNHRGGLKGK